MQQDSKEKGAFRRAIRNIFIKGLMALVPTAVTILIIVKAYQFVDANFASFIVKGLESLLGRSVPHYIGMAGAVLVVFILGLILASFIGRKIWGAIEFQLHRLPLVRSIYPAMKQITEFVLSEQRVRFHRIVAIPYPRPGMYTLALVTGGGLRSVEKARDAEFLTVFIPTAPAPMTGIIVFVRRDEVIDIPVTVEDALKFVASAGTLTPPSQLPEGALTGRPHIPSAPPKEKNE